MARLFFEISISDSVGETYRRFGHRILYLVAGDFSAIKLTYDEPGGGTYALDYENKRAAWKKVSLAIQGARSLRMAMPKDSEMEKYYSAHTQLADAINHVSIYAVKPAENRSFDWYPEHQIDIFDVTVSQMVTAEGMTFVGLYYSGATKEWF
jgi:hypothetical protein